MKNYQLIISIYDILKKIEIPLNEDNPVQIEYIEDDTPRTYTDIIAEISPYASAAPRNQRVMNILTNAIDDLHSAEKEIATGMPPTNRAKWKISVTSITKCYLRWSRKDKKK